MINNSRKPLAAAVGAAFMVSVAVSPLAFAGENPFQVTQLGTGYNLAAKAEGEGKCGEGKCGEGKAAMKAEEGKCGEGKAAMKAGEGKCGEGKAAAAKTAEGKCGEGKCGEGKCGQGKSADKPAQ